MKIVKNSNFWVASGSSHKELVILLNWRYLVKSLSSPGIPTLIWILKL